MRFKRLNELLGVSSVTQKQQDELVPNPYYTEGSGLSPFIKKSVLNEPGLEEVNPEDYMSMGSVGVAKNSAKPIFKNALNVESLAGIKNFFDDFVNMKKIQKEALNMKPKNDINFFDQIRLKKLKSEIADAQSIKNIKDYLNKLKKD